MTRCRHPERIVCLSAETVEVLYLLDESRRIVGVCGYSERPAAARREKPTVSAFTHANLDKIIALEPDLVLAYSDLQADMAAQLARRGVQVHLFNQRNVAGILNMMRLLGAMVGAHERADELAAEHERHVAAIRDATTTGRRRPAVYFEEWDDPMISGIGWVSELIEIAGGRDCFAELASRPLARDRIIADPGEVIRRRPDIIIGSWCGKPFLSDEVVRRPGWDAIPAVRDGRLHEIRSCDILQPGPAALRHGLDQLHRCILAWTGGDQDRAAAAPTPAN